MRLTCVARHAGSSPTMKPTATASTPGGREHPSIHRRRRPVHPREDDRARESAEAVRHDHPARRAGTGEQQRFDEQQAHETRSSGAERRTQRDLARPPQSTREQQVRDVRAGDQQHDERDADSQRTTVISGASTPASFAEIGATVIRPFATYGSVPV